MFLGENFKLTKKMQKRKLMSKLLREKRRSQAAARKNRSKIYTKGLHPIDKNKKILIFSEPGLPSHIASMNRGAYAQSKEAYRKGLVDWYADNPEMEGFHLKPVNKTGRKGKRVRRNSNGFLG